MSPIPGREDALRTQRMSEHEIRHTITDMNMGSWISSLVFATLENAEFANDDFVGSSGDAVSIPELVEATVYYAKKMGYDPSWELAPSASSAPSEIFDDFERRSCVYDALSKKVDNWSTLKGGRKLALVKKTVRARVSQKAETMCAKPDSLQVLGSESEDMASIYTETNYKKFFCMLHRLGGCDEEDPRYYIHMVYRYYMNNLHRKLADDNAVLRFPSIQKVMDVKKPVNTVGSTPPEFRMFLKHAKGNAVTVVTLPVPSKEKANEVVYRYSFEKEVVWVPVMRCRIFDVFTELGSRDSSRVAQEIYPKYLVKGEGGSVEGNRTVVTTLARSIEINGLMQTLSNAEKVSPETKKLLRKVLLIDPRVCGIFTRYNNHPFLTEGEQLRERLGFLLQSSVRGVFRYIAKKLSNFCNDIYAGLSMPYATMDVFVEYCTTKNSMKYQQRSETTWREFVINVRKICCILHAWSRKGDVDEFMRTHVSTDAYFNHVLKEL